MPIGTSGGSVILTRDMTGIAPDVNIINLKVLNDTGTGTGTDSRVIAAIDRAIALKNTYNIRVMNLSLGRPVTVSYKNDPLCMAVEKAWKAGIVVVVAAGNYGRLNLVGNQGYGTIAAPGNDPFVITVGAMKAMDTSSRSDDQIASYSSKGPSLIDRVMKPDLVAPGNQIISTAIPAMQDSTTDLFRTHATTRISSSLLWNVSTSTDTWFFRLNGTSMAAPVVSGAAALLLQKDPTLTPDQVKARLMTTASKWFPKRSTATDPATGISYTASYDAFTVGAGYLNIAAALANTKKPAGNAQSPTLKLVNGKPAVVRPTGSAFISSGNSIVWGDNIVWGDSVVWNTATSRGYSVLWGTGTTSGTNVVWGDANLQSTTAMNVLTRGE